MRLGRLGCPAIKVSKPDRLSDVLLMSWSESPGLASNCGLVMSTVYTLIHGVLVGLRLDRESSSKATWRLSADRESLKYLLTLRIGYNIASATEAGTVHRSNLSVEITTRTRTSSSTPLTTFSHAQNQASASEPATTDSCSSAESGIAPKV